VAWSGFIGPCLARSRTPGHSEPMTSSVALYEALTSATDIVALVKLL